MRKLAAAVILAALLAGAYAIGRWSGPPQAVGTAAAADGPNVLTYACPMHPQYRSDKPGDCMACGMRLEAVRAVGDTRTSQNRAADEPRDLPAGCLHVSPEKQQMVGVRVVRAQLARGDRTIRTVGRAATDDNCVYRVVAGTNGRVIRLSQAVTGTVVRKGQLLAAFYSRDFLGLQQALLYALNTRDRLRLARKQQPATPPQVGRGAVVLQPQVPVAPDQAALTDAQLKSAEENLRTQGMGDEQIRAIERTRKMVDTVDIRAPVTGIVLDRGIYPGARFEDGAELYRIADLSRIWVLAEVFEDEAQQLRPGRVVRVAVPRVRQTFRAVVSRALPQFDPETRRLRVRLEAANPSYLLRPGMLLDVELPERLSSAVTVPVDAVLDSGLRRTVFVDRGGGYFEPRPVETGWRAADRVAITRGLKPGERVVVSGSFLLDSESRMAGAAAAARSTPAGAERPRAAAHRTAAAAGPAALAAKDPVCGMTVDPARAPGPSVHAGVTYYFCSPVCKQQFDRSPARYLAP